MLLKDLALVVLQPRVPSLALVHDQKHPGNDGIHHQKVHKDGGHVLVPDRVELRVESQ